MATRPRILPAPRGIYSQNRLLLPVVVVVAVVVVVVVVVVDAVVVVVFFVTAYIFSSFCFLGRITRTILYRLELTNLQFFLLQAKFLWNLR